MYSDPEKNIVMLLPDGFTDDEIIALGSIAFPEDIEDTGGCNKPTGFINLYNLHATYELNEITPTESCVIP